MIVGKLYRRINPLNAIMRTSTGTNYIFNSGDIVAVLRIVQDQPFVEYELLTTNGVLGIYRYNKNMFKHLWEELK